MKELKLERPLAVFDLETTGTDTVYDQIVEIAIVKMYPDRDPEEWVQRLRPGIPIPEAATAVHGITMEDVEHAPTFRAMSGEIMKRLEGCDIGGFNVMNFDLPLLRSEFRRCGQFLNLSAVQIVDAMTIYHNMEPRGLSAAFRLYTGKTMLGAHSALADSRATLAIIKGQAQRYSKALAKHGGGVDGMAVLTRTASSWFSKRDDGSGWEIRRGKHRGRTLSEVWGDDPGYVRWMSGLPDMGQEDVALVRGVMGS